MSKKQRSQELNDAIMLLASKIPFGELKASTTPAAFLREVAEELDARAVKVRKLGKYASAVKRCAMKQRGATTPWMFRNDVRCELGVSLDKNAGNP